MIRGKLAALAAALLLSTTAATVAEAQSRIVNGLNTQGFPTTGHLLYSQNAGINITANNASSWCTGTLIGCETFLTAAHCVEDDQAAGHYWVYLQHGGIHTVSSVTMHPGYAGNSGRDVAVLKLAQPVTGIDPTTINTTHDLDAMGVGLEGTIAGFGRTGGGSDYGIKRWGLVVTADCDTAATEGEGNDKLVCWDYDSSVGDPGDDSNTCNGDSGGPLFMSFGSATELVGVTSAGTATNCGPGDHSWDASVYYNAAWIGSQLGADSTAACGSIPAVGSAGVTTFENSGSLSAANSSASFEVTLTGTPSLVRFTLNGTDNGSFNPNFFVKQGSGASAASYNCKDDAASPFGACSFNAPAAGVWSVYVSRQSGSGEWQITTTVFGSAAPVCGNGVVESGEDCDGSNLGSCPVGPCNACECPVPSCGNDVVEDGEDCDGSDLGICAVGPCTACECPAPSCGNNLVEGSEVCDGTDDSACPGLCNGSCGCDAPVCGDNNAEGSEDCDGTDDAACPGACLGDCTCTMSCSSEDLYGLKIVSDDFRLQYRALLYDPTTSYSTLDPRARDFTLSITDGGGLVDLTIPASDVGWIKADTIKRKFGWKGDGANDGLRRVKLAYKDAYPTPYWLLLVKGKLVPGAGSIDLSEVLDFELGLDGTCHTESW